MKYFKFYRQLNSMDCGPTCVRMIARHYGKRFKIDNVRRLAGFNKDGVSMLGISEAAQKIGFETRGVRITFDQLVNNTHLPCILHWDQNHFVVLISVRRSLFRKGYFLTMADPAKGVILYNKDEFTHHWFSTANDHAVQVGTALLLEPTPQFYEQAEEQGGKLSWQLSIKYLMRSRRQVIRVFIALLIGSLLSLLFPFLTQNIVDKGINARNLQYVTIILVAQITLIVSRIIVDFIRMRLLMRISISINLNMLSDFWIKLTKLPLSYFENHHIGDIMQRLNDNRLIQNFLTSNAISTLFSLTNFLIYSVVLLIYNTKLFFVFFAGSFLYFLWIKMFMRIRRKINYQSFDLSAKENNATVQLVHGMQTIRLHNAEMSKRREWENIQGAIFRLGFKNLNYGQLQQAGALLISQGKDILITFFVAQLVIAGKLTFGSMFAIQYILGHLSGPIEQFISFLQSAQDAKISMDRLNEIHELDDEEEANRTYVYNLSRRKDIRIKNLSFGYPGANGELVLKNITLDILQGKATAIVGASGSGKTTLLKLLLRFYDNYRGEVEVGEMNLKDISPTYWRKQCGAVLQDGYIFDDTISRNITIGNEEPIHLRLIHSCEIANILSFIESLPNGFDTKLGSEGIGISQGQKQRLLIARAIYKDPEYVFFDEATNALDADNEKAIVENLNGFLKGRTVVIVAHRLSTVKNADKIIVLHNGTIVEEGNHGDLTKKKGRYYELVKNQLELGN